MGRSGGICVDRSISWARERKLSCRGGRTINKRFFTIPTCSDLEESACLRREFVFWSIGIADHIHCSRIQTLQRRSLHHCSFQRIDDLSGIRNLSGDGQRVTKILSGVTRRVTASVLEPFVIESVAHSTGVHWDDSCPIRLERWVNVPLSNHCRVQSEGGGRGGIAALRIAINIIRPETVDTEILRSIRRAQGAIEMSQCWIMSTLQTLTKLWLPDLGQQEEIIVSIASLLQAIWIGTKANHRRGSWETYLTTKIKILIPS